MLTTLEKNRAEFWGSNGAEIPESERPQGFSVSWGKTYWSTIDANGNLVKDDTKTYTWDAQNRLIQINWINPQPVSMVDTVQMTYDGFGRRVNITELTWDHCFNGKDLCLVMGQSFAKKGQHWACNCETVFHSWVNKLVTNNYFYTLDHLGNIREMTDSSGAIHASYDYDAFGRQVKLSGDLESDFGYAGYYNYETTNQYLTWYRVYDPNLGRWLSSDPLGELEGPNLYNYVDSNPLNWIDPFGLCPTTPPDPNNTKTRIPVPHGKPGSKWVKVPGSGKDGYSKWVGQNPDGSQVKTPNGNGAGPQLVSEPARGKNDPYFKVSNGERGNQRYNLNGDPISPNQAHAPPVPQTDPKCDLNEDLNPKGDIPPEILEGKFFW